jgi:phosphate starvation-inducible PhoH-like protein
VEEKVWAGAAKKKFRHSVVVTAQTAGQKEYIKAINANDIVFCIGPAGSGKTAVAVGLALQNMLCDNPAYEKLIVVRPAKEACDEKIGFLPGSMDEKMAPWAAPVLDNMKVFIDQSQIKNMFFENRVEIIPLAYLRGRSLNHSFIIVDEAQNCTPKQMLMILTRLGKGSKMLINGDIAQSDIRVESGLAEAYRLYKDVDGIEFVEMGLGDIVRHPLVAAILQKHAEGIAAGMTSN